MQCCGAQGASRTPAPRRSNLLRWPVRTDARCGPAARASSRGAAGTHLVRRPDGEAEPGTDRRNRQPTFNPTHLQSRTRQFHADEMSVGPGERTRELEEGPVADAAQGLCPIAVDGRA